MDSRPAGKAREPWPAGGVRDLKPVGRAIDPRPPGGAKAVRSAMAVLEVGTCGEGWTATECLEPAASVHFE